MTTTTRMAESTETAGRLYVAIETGEKYWTLGLSVGLGQSTRRRRMPARDTARLLAEITEAKRRFGLSAAAAVMSCYEAGREGFWLHRWCEAQGLANLVLDSSSIEVNRRARRAKSDGLDVDGLVRLLMRWVAGDRRACRVVTVPSVEAEDARHEERELDAAKHDRKRVRNRMLGLLATQGVRLAIEQWPHLVDRLVTGDGRALPATLRARLQRDWDALRALTARITTLEALRRERLAADPMARHLARLRGIGDTGAGVLVAEWFRWRTFRHPREVGGLAGLTPTPYDSGDARREQGIGKHGNRRVRAIAVELAWCWLRYQPHSALAQWYGRRFCRGSARLRRIGIVAVARKLLIALWRFVQLGVVPDGATLKPIAQRG